MAPDGMQEMATKIAPVPGGEAGTYKFKATFGMAGRWQLSLGAKVQGETGTVESKFVITAQKRTAPSSPASPSSRGLRRREADSSRGTHSVNRAEHQIRP